MDKSISIIIVTYNSYDLILDCIHSIFSFNDLEDDKIEIIVVDNSSLQEGEKLKQLLSENYGNRIVFIKNENKGYGHGNNLGIKNSSGDIIAIMNPDVRLSEPLFRKTVELFSDTEVASVGFKQINGAGDFSFFRLPEFFSPFLYSLKNRIANKEQKFNQYEYSLSGAFVFFKRKYFKQIGMYDEDFFMYFEEADTARRINLINKKILYDNSKSYIHLMEQKESFNHTLLDIGTESIRIYFSKYNLDVKKYIRRRLLELYTYKFLFSVVGNTERKVKAQAYIKSLKKLL